MSEDNTQRWLWIEEIAQGPFSVSEMYRMATSGEIGPATLFWSNAKQQWFPLVGVMFDIEPNRLDEMISAGIKTVLGSDQDDWTACSALAGKVYPIAAPPVLPPADCACVPWCRLMVAAES